MTDKNTKDEALESVWEPVVRLGTFTPLEMRQRDASGVWVYRKPTEQEIQEYVSSEGW